MIGWTVDGASLSGSPVSSGWWARLESELDVRGLSGREIVEGTPLVESATLYEPDLPGRDLWVLWVGSPEGCVTLESLDPSWVASRIAEVVSAQ